ncbi:MAG: DUF4142 domain-containing protein [Saprospiraceae bacterium]|nr:DUF4142 domain-containing protein [Saprospiraceae bacterium]
MSNFIQKGMLLLTLVSTTLLIVSCSNNRKADDSKEMAEDQNERKFDDNNQQSDSQFLYSAAEMILKEIQLGKLAQQKGKDKQVIDLGKMLEKAHTESLSELTSLAETKMISIPIYLTEDTQADYKSLNEISGNDFDKAYADLMVKDHQDAYGFFEKASTDSFDPDIKIWAAVVLPVLKSHLDHSLDCQKKL